MAAPSGRRRVSVPRPVAIILLLAVGVGVAAAALSAPAPNSPPPATTTSSGFVPYSVVLAAVLGFLALLVFIVIWARLTTGGAGMPLQFGLMVLAAFIVGLVFIAAVHVIGNSGGIPGLLPGTPVPSSGTTPPNQPPPGPNQTPPANPPRSQFAGIDLTELSAWVGLIILLVAALFIAGPIVAAFGSRRKKEDLVRDEVATFVPRRAFVDALAALAHSTEPTDPRLVMIQLYGRLLERVGPSIANMETATAREIEQTCISHWRLDPGTSTRLRRLFEQARYSTLPFGPTELREARDALTQALTELDRRRVAA